MLCRKMPKKAVWPTWTNIRGIKEMSWLAQQHRKQNSKQLFGDTELFQELTQ